MLYVKKNRLFFHLDFSSQIYFLYKIYAIIAFPVFGTFVFLSAPTLLINHYHHPLSTIHHLPQLSTITTTPSPPFTTYLSYQRLHCLTVLKLERCIVLVKLIYQLSTSTCSHTSYFILQFVYDILP